LQEKHGKLERGQNLALYRFAQDASKKEVMGLVLWHNESNIWVRVQKAVASEHKEASVGIERRLQKIDEEFSEDAAAVNAGLVKAMLVDHFNDQAAALQVGAVLGRQVFEGVLVHEVAPHSDAARRVVHVVALVGVVGEEGLQELDAVAEGKGEGKLLENGEAADVVDVESVLLLHEELVLLLEEIAGLGDRK